MRMRNDVQKDAKEGDFFCLPSSLVQSSSGKFRRALRSVRVFAPSDCLYFCHRSDSSRKFRNARNKGCLFEAVELHSFWKSTSLATLPFVCIYINRYRYTYQPPPFLCIYINRYRYTYQPPLFVFIYI